MHVGRKYKLTHFLGWTGREIAYLTGWSLLVTVALYALRGNFLNVPVTVLTIIGSALAIILAFKNQQCYARSNDALMVTGQLITNSLILANRLTTMVGTADTARSSAEIKAIFYRHFAWLTALRFFLRGKRLWENRSEAGNAGFLAGLPTPESQSTVKDELKALLPDAELEQVLTYRGDKEALILQRQYAAMRDLADKKLVTEYVQTLLTGTLDDLSRLQGGLKRIKNYPYARNYYSIAVFLVTIFVALVPFGLFPYARELGKPAGLEHWTVWLNIPFSVIVGWVFVSLEKVGENSSNPFEGGANDVPITFIARRIEIEMRLMLGEETTLKPIEAKDNILF